MAISPNQYNFNSIHVLNVGGYNIDWEVKGPFKTAILRDKSGAIVGRGSKSSTASPSVLIEELITFYADSLFYPLLPEGGNILQQVTVIQLIPLPPLTPEQNTYNVRIVGTILDKNTKNPISNAIVTPNLVEKIKLIQGSTFNPAYVEENEEGYSGGNTIGAAVTLDPEFSDELGKFSIDYASGDIIDFNISDINVSKPKYFERSIKNLQLTGKIQISPSNFDVRIPPEGDKINVDVYDLGNILLETEELNVAKEEIKIKTEIQKQENKVVETITRPQIPFESRMATLFETKKERIKQLFIPIILGMISSFGSNALHSIANKQVNALKNKTCPNPDKILEILKKRNKLVKELNNTYKIVRRISKITNTTQGLITGFKIGISGVKFIPSPPFAPTTLFASGLAELEKLLDKAGLAINALNLVASTVGMMLGIMIDLLNNLDFLIQDCSEEQDIPFEALNNEFANLVDETSSSDNELLGVINPLTNKPYPYKGFTFEIKDDKSQSFKYPKRYAIARNIQGIEMLRSDSSFASGPEVLIEELKFIIDRDNLRAD